MGGGGGIIGAVLGAGVAAATGGAGLAVFPMGMSGLMAGASLGSTIGSGIDMISGGSSAKSGAKEQAALQQAQIAEQRQQAAAAARITEIKNARAARIQSARIAGSIAGAGAGGGILDMPLLDLNTSLTTNINDINANLDSQNNQFGIASSQASLTAKMAIDKANAAIWKGVFGIAGGVAQSGVVQNMFSTDKSKGPQTLSEYTSFMEQPDTSYVVNDYFEEI